MKIYTSYFALFKQFPLNAFPISIALYPPEWYLGRRCYDKLAPTPEILREWKAHHDKDLYIESYNEEVLSKLSPVTVVNDMMKIARGYEPDEFLEEDASLNEDRDVILLCYEAPDQFCHRHLVAQWLQSAGYLCDEWSKVVPFYEKKRKPKILFGTST